MGKWLADHVEDVFLAGGATLASAGLGTQFGLGIGMIGAGVLCIAYGVWIARS